MEGTRNLEVYKFWSENLKYREHLEKFRHRWKNNIKMDIQERGWLDSISSIRNE
jgi:hypothetical protein